MTKIPSKTSLAGIALIAMAAAVACSNPLDVVTTSRIPAENIEIPANAKLLVDGAIGDFECAFASYVVQGGITGEELIYAQQTADRTPNDARRTSINDVRYATNSCQGLGVYGPVQIARNSAETVLRYLNGWTDEEVPVNRTNLIAISAAYAGYSLVLLGEGFCTMAISSINPDRTITYGREIERDSVFKLAVARFTEAIDAARAATPANTSIERMALVGRARAKANLGDYPGAEQDAALVPAGFSFNATYSAAVARRGNFVFGDNSSTTRSSSVGDPYRSMAGDPRVPVVNSGITTPATGIQHWYQTKYANGDAPIPLATYEEAQLIIAEARIRANDLPAALPIITASRTRGSQGAFAGTTNADYMNELIDQRRRELFLESHHLGDILRFGITPSPAAGTPYHFGGGTYGTQICFPVPSSERLNNPLIGG